MPRLLPLCLVVPALAAGCYDLPDIEPDVCGNKVIDGAEDCDGFSEYGGETVCGAPELEDEGKQCLYLCDSATPCPPGWGCGLDGVCSRPEGTFVNAPLSPWHMPVDEFAIGDVDGDGNADLIGNDPAQIVVRFGSQNAEFPDELSTPIRRPTGVVTYTHFDDDNRLDAIVPIDLGLFVLRGEGSRALESVAYSPFSSGGVVVEFHAIEHPAFIGPEVLIFDLQSNSMAFLTQDPDQPEIAVAIEPPAVDAYGLILPPAVGDVNGVALRPEFALTYYNDRQVHIYTTTGLPGGPDDPPTLAPELFQSLTLPLQWRVHQGAMFAEVDGQNGLDLIISALHTPDEGDPELGILVAYNDGNSLAAPVRVPELEVFSIPDLGMNLPLATADFDGNGLGDYVTAFGAFMAFGPGGAGSPPNELQGLATSLPDLWSDAAVGDFNGDGNPDIAVSRFDSQNGRVLSGVDFFLSAGAGLFNPFHVQTGVGGPRLYPRSLTIGDFDGDLIQDVAFFQEVSSDLPEGRLMVAFGAADGLFADATLMGRFRGQVQMTPSMAALSPGSLDGITDLFVISYDDQTAPEVGSAISVMFGDSSRRMVAPLILDPSLVGGGAPSDPQQPRRAMVGDFNEDEIRDFLILADDAFFGGDGSNDLHRFVWFIPGVNGDGSVDPSGAVYTDMFGDAMVGDFNFGCSTWEVVDLEEQGDILRTPDELIGLDDSSACAFRGEENVDPEIMVVKVDPSSAEPMKMSKVAFGGDLTFPDHLAADDFDDDGDLDPVVLFQGSVDYADPQGEGDGGYSVAGAGVGVIWNDGAKMGGDDGVVDEGEYAAVPLPEGVLPIKVAALAINEDAHRDLLILTDSGIFMSLRDPNEERTFQQPVLINELYEGRLLGAGDVNGDGLTDFAVVHGQNVSVLLAVKAPRKGEDDRYGADGTTAQPTGVDE